MATINFKFSNGDVLKDKVTGLTGVVMVCAAYATGCVHYGLLQRELNNGKPCDWEWIDESRLELKKAKAVSFSQQDGLSGGPSPNGPNA